MKVLPQFADQVVVIFLSFPRLCMKSSLVTSAEIYVFFCCSAGFHGSIWNIRCHSHLHIFFFHYGCLYIVVVHFPGILNKIIDKFPGAWQYKHWSSFFLSWVSTSNSVLRWMLFYCGGCCFTAVDIVFHRKLTEFLLAEGLGFTFWARWFFGKWFRSLRTLGVAGLSVSFFWILSLWRLYIVYWDYWQFLWWSEKLTTIISDDAML